MGSRKISRDDYPLIAQLRALRYPYYSIGNVFGVSANRIFEICRDQGYKMEDYIHAQVLETVRGLGKGRNGQR